MNLYFDNAATSWPKAPGVKEAVCENIDKGKGSPGRTFNQMQNKLLFSVRESLAGFIGADDSSRIVFGLNTTQMINTGVQGILRPGDHVVTTSIEHNAVSRPLRYLEKCANICLTIVPATSEGYFDDQEILNAVTDHTRLVIVNHASNVTGAVNSLTVLGQALQKTDTFFFVDCAQSIGAVEINVQTDGIDMLAGPAHKNLLGPSGTGFLYMSKRCRPQPLIHGGTGSYSDLDYQPDVMPDCYESGTPNMPGLAGFKASLDFIRHIGVKTIEKKKKQLSAKILDGLTGVKGLTLHGPCNSENRLPVFSFSVPGKELSDVADRLATEYGVITRTGLHCSPWTHKTIGTYPTGTVRVSAGYFHTDRDIEEMVKAVDCSIRHGK